MMKNLVDVVLGGVTYWAFGYGMSYGESSLSSWFMGWGSWFVDDVGVVSFQSLTPTSLGSGMVSCYC